MAPSSVSQPRTSNIDRYRVLLLVVVIARVMLGLNTVFAARLWVHHEADFFNVMRFMATEGRLPTVSDYPDRTAADLAQATQPPLYYMAGYPIVALLDDGQPIPLPPQPSIICDSYRVMLDPLDPWPPQGTQMAAYGLRILNLLFAAGAVVATYAIGRLLFPDRPALALIAAAFMAFEPQTFTLSTEINIDTLVLLLSSLNLYFTAHLIRVRRLTWRNAAGLTITVLLSILTKPNGWAVVLVTAGVLMGVMLAQVRRKHWRAIRYAGLAALVFVVLILAVSLFNLATYGSVVGRYESMLQKLVDNAETAFSMSLLQTVFEHTRIDYLQQFPIQRQKALALYVGITLVALGGAVLAWVGALWRKQRAAVIAISLLLGTTAITTVMVVLRNSHLSEAAFSQAFAPIRYYVTALPALALLMSLGFEAVTRLVIGRWRPAWGWIAGAGWAALWVGIVAWNALAIPAERPTILDAAQLAAMDVLPIQRTNPNASITTLGYTTAAENDALTLAVYNTLSEETSANHIGRIDLVDAAGTATACEFLPASGLYPTWRWQADGIVATQVTVPNCTATALSGPIDITLSWYTLDESSQIDTASLSSVTLGQWAGTLPPSPDCHTNLGVFADTFQVVKFNAPSTATPGELYLPSVNWYVRQTVADTSVARYYTLTHDQQETQYECHGIPRLQSHPFRLWERGDVVYFDECRFRFPRNAPTGTYTVAVHMTDGDGVPLPITSDNGTLASDRIVVGSVELRAPAP